MAEIINDKLSVQNIFSLFETIQTDFNIQTINLGHINQTYKITNGTRQYILQRLNRNVFPDLETIQRNSILIGDYLESQMYPFPIPKILNFKNGKKLYNGEWRVLSYIENSVNFEKVQSVAQTFEAAKFLSEFHVHLLDFKHENIKPAIPNFLEFHLRYQQYQLSQTSANTDRLKKADNTLKQLEEYYYILEQWQKTKNKFPLRIIHADPKISNFLFDSKNTENIRALIDWDTIMTGTILYDFGDMARSYTNIGPEDNGTPNSPIFSKEHYQALKDGFLYFLKPHLERVEIEHLDLAAQVVIYIQSIRFLTDYFNNDQYYQTSHSDQNLYRAQNQLRLLQELTHCL